MNSFGLGFDFRPMVPWAGDGYFAGEPALGDEPDGLARIMNEPSRIAIRVFERRGMNCVAQALSAFDGTWRVDGLRRTDRYMVVGVDGRATVNSAIQDWVSPAESTGPVPIPFRLDAAFPFVMPGQLLRVLVSTSGASGDVTFDVIDGAMPAGFTLQSAGSFGIISGAVTSNDGALWTLRGTDELGREVAIACELPTNNNVFDVLLKAGSGSGIDFSWDRARAITTTTSWRGAFAIIGRSSGKYAFELIQASGDGQVGSGQNSVCGIATKENLNSQLADMVGNALNSVGYYGGSDSTGALTWTLDTGNSVVSVAAYRTADVITVAVDADAPEVTFYKNGAFQAAVPLPAGKTWFPTMTLRRVGTVGLVRTTGLSFLPSGFSEWNAT
ncbi:hypothetical protein [Luteimonas notoginsengisoli]|uniref:B30.2/SPRY domain-containing protein n=1 Tax=Luteimonas notoginsengisoli TaxID=1578200 RepID=A0ABV7UR90_9GAMM